MALLPESSTWETGIYQLEETDVVQGGPNGIDNLQAKQLVNRTLYLKNQVDAMVTGKQPIDALLTAIAALVTSSDKVPYFTGADTVALTTLTAYMRTVLAAADQTAARALLGAATQADINTAIAALVASSPAVLDTLNELAVALGNDPNFATTISNALALKAPLVSPALTGSPTAPTAASGTNNTQIASTAFVQQEIAAQGGVKAGTIIEWPGSSAPAGYLACPTAPTNISRTTYAALFAAIGTTWGAGDGSTTFGMPYFPPDYAAVQANGNIATTTVGQVISHSHEGTTRAGQTGTGGGSNYLANPAVATGATGGAANLAAGVRILKCIKF